MEYQVIYSSETGNTKKIAKEIFYVLPGMAKDICDLTEGEEPKEANIYFVGSPIHCETCDERVRKVLSTLHGKQVALFFTCGMRGGESYYARLEQEIKRHLPEDNAYLGSFVCQGKMPMEIRRKCECMRNQGLSEEKAEFFLKNFDEGMLHPDETDLQHAEQFVKEILQKKLEKSIDK